MSNRVVECPKSKAYFLCNTATHFHANTWLSLMKVHVDELKSVCLIKSQFMIELIKTEVRFHSRISKPKRFVYISRNSLISRLISWSYIVGAKVYCNSVWFLPTSCHWRLSNVRFALICQTVTRIRPLGGPSPKHLNSMNGWSCYGYNFCRGTIAGKDSKLVWYTFQCFILHSLLLF